MGTAQPAPRMSVEEYLTREAQSDVRHEYAAGPVFAMTGGSRAHNLISGNFYALSRKKASESGCDAFISDMRDARVRCCTTRMS